MLYFTTRILAAFVGLLTTAGCSRHSSNNLRDPSAAGSRSSEDTSPVGLVFSSTAALPVCSMDRKGMVIFVPAQSGVAAKECNGLGTWNILLASTRVTIPGSVGAVKTSTIPSANLARCPNGKGGLLISTWDDMNFDDIYTAGIDKDFAERAVCNGDKGDAGANSLVNNQPIAAGAFSACPFGGAKLASGVDSNKNGILDLAEATVSYICNGVKGEKGAVGDKGENGAPAVVAQKSLASSDAKCPSGGVALESFTDNGSLTKEGEIGAPDGQYTAGIYSNYQEPSFICNGRPVSVAIESSQRCPAGGVTLILYRDNNSSGKFDRDAGDDYISGTSVCDGIQGAPGKSSYVRVAILASKSAECPSGGIKLESGFVGEEAAAKFSPPVCNGANGIINVADSAPGCGIVGGKTFQSFTDINNNGTYEKDFDLNYKETEVCNGSSKMVEELLANIQELRARVSVQEIEVASFKVQFAAFHLLLRAVLTELTYKVDRIEAAIGALIDQLKVMVIDLTARGDAFKTEIEDLKILIKQLQDRLPVENPVSMRGLLVLASDRRDGRTVWEFTIKQGTGSNPWNSIATALEVKVGEVLRIRNADDSASHGLHTNMTPCRHGGTRQYDGQGNRLTNDPNKIEFGAFIECDIGSAIDASTSESSNPIYDEYSGTSARLYLISRSEVSVTPTPTATPTASPVNSATDVNKVSLEPYGTRGKIYAFIGDQLAGAVELTGNGAVNVTVTGPFGSKIRWTNSVTAEEKYTLLDGMGDYGIGDYVNFNVATPTITATPTATATPSATPTPPTT